jgi:hypothetical protein
MVLLSSLLPTAHAANQGFDLISKVSCAQTGNCKIDDIINGFGVLLNWGVSISGAIALLMFIIGGVYLLASAGRADKGVLIQVLLDPTKTSCVNLASAQKLSLASHRSIKLKWASAATAQIIIARSKADKQMTVITGSSSLTRRDLDNYNLQSNLALVLNTDWKLAADFDDYFASAWQVGTEYSTNESLAWYLPYLLGLQEWTGMGSF